MVALDQRNCTNIYYVFYIKKYFSENLIYESTTKSAKYYRFNSC